MTTLCTAVQSARACVQSARACTVQIGDFRIIRRGRFWVVKDPDGSLICMTVYKKGALEVVRRLLPPEKRHLADEVRRKCLPASARSPRCRYSADHNNAHSR